MRKLILIQKSSRNSRPLAWKLEDRWLQQWGDLPERRGCLNCSRGSYRASPSSIGESKSLDATRKSMSPTSLNASSTGMTCLTGHSGSTLIRTENVLLVSAFNLASRAFSSSTPIFPPSMLAFPSRSIETSKLRLASSVPATLDCRIWVAARCNWVSDQGVQTKGRSVEQKPMDGCRHGGARRSTTGPFRSWANNM